MSEQNTELAIQNTVPLLSVNKPPQDYGDLVKNDALRKFFIDTSDRYRGIPPNKELKRYLELLQKEIGGLKQKIAKEHPTYPDEKMDALFDVVFGFRRLDPTEAVGSEKLTFAEREVSARIQQSLTHHVLFAGTTEAADAYSDSIYSIIRNTAIQTESLRKLYSENQLISSWRGLRNETAIARTLLQGDYKVYVPNYAQEPNEDLGFIPDNSNEILQLDVKRGIDLIAVSPDGFVYVLDAKARTHYPTPNSAVLQDVVMDHVQEVQLTPQTFPLVRSAIESVHPDPEKILRGTVIIPARKVKLSDLALNKHSTAGEQKQSLANLGGLPAETQIGIMQQLEQLKESNSKNLPKATYR